MSLRFFIKLLEFFNGERRGKMYIIGVLDGVTEGPPTLNNTFTIYN
jgi:hypothetical protein